MRTFLVQFALGYVAMAWLLSTAAHLARPRNFAELIRRHGILPAALGTPAAQTLLALEIALGGGALFLLASPWHREWIVAVLASSALVGAGLTLYVWRLLSTASTETPCGCSPFASRLTSASYFPAAGLLGVALCGWAAAANGAPLPDLASRAVAVLIPASWGSMLALGIAMVPATVPGRLGAKA